MLTACLTRKLWLTSLVNALIAAVLFLVGWFIICSVLALKGVALGETIRPATIFVGLGFVLITNLISSGTIHRLVRTLVD